MLPIFLLLLLILLLLLLLLSSCCCVDVSSITGWLLLLQMLVLLLILSSCCCISVSSIAGCLLVPARISMGCVYKEGREECRDEVVAAVTEVPREVCDLLPHKTCHLATKLVPQLKPVPQCSSVPRQSCRVTHAPRRRRTRKVRSRWCIESSALPVHHKSSALPVHHMSSALPVVHHPSVHAAPVRSHGLPHLASIPPPVAAVPTFPQRLHSRPQLQPAPRHLVERQEFQEDIPFLGIPFVGTYGVTAMLSDNVRDHRDHMMAGHRDLMMADHRDHMMAGHRDHRMASHRDLMMAEHRDLMMAGQRDHMMADHGDHMVGLRNQIVDPRDHMVGLEMEDNSVDTGFSYSPLSAARVVLPPLAMDRGTASEMSGREGGQGREAREGGQGRGRREKRGRAGRAREKMWMKGMQDWEQEKKMAARKKMEAKKKMAAENKRHHMDRIKGFRGAYP